MKSEKRLKVLMDAADKHIDIAYHGRHTLDFESHSRKFNSLCAFNTVKSCHFNRLSQIERKKFLMHARECSDRLFGKNFNTIEEHVYWNMNISPVFEHFDGEPLWNFKKKGLVRDYGEMPKEHRKQMQTQIFDDIRSNLENRR